MFPKEYSMSKNISIIQAYLFSDNQDDSLQARKLLNDSSIIFKEAIEFNTFHDYGLTPPTLISREGDFVGLLEIKEFIEIVTNRPELSL